jgi:RNA polymerase sigma-70 factor (ECF subfamily)
MEHINLVASNGESGVNGASLFFSGDYERIYRYILSMVKDVKEAEDLTQETFIRAYRNRTSLRDQGAQTAWLYKIATHACFDRLRQYARRNPRETEAQIEELDIADACVPTLQKLSEQDEMSTCVQNYLNSLPDNYRAVILLHDMHELTASEVSQLLGESLATVKIRLHRAHIKLKAALQTGCDFSVDENSVLTCESK